MGKAPKPKRHAAAERALASIAVALGLASCIGLGRDGPTPDGLVGQAPARSGAVEATIGEGPVPIAMLLPLSAGGSASGLAQAFQNAAQLAIDEAAQDNVRIEVRDTAGDAEVARLAAQSAIADGARLVLGPVFAPAVSGAGEPARGSAVPVVAFSTDASVAGRGIYLLSFLPRQDAARVVSYAADEGIAAFAALVPDNGYGLVMEAAFRESVAAVGGRVVAVERYEPGGIAEAAGRLSATGPFEAVFIPDGGDDPAAAAAALQSAGQSPRLLGSGQWDNPAVLGAPGLVGAWYPGPQKGGFDGFSQRYAARYGAQPPRTASLVYDAALLANGLAGARGEAAFTSTSLQASDGFIGVDGIFRLTGDGLSERGLAVYEVGPDGAARVVSPAPAKFSRAF